MGCYPPRRPFSALLCSDFSCHRFGYRDDYGDPSCRRSRRRFDVAMTTVMEMGLIHPPVRANIVVIENTTSDIPLSQIIWGTMPFLGLMFPAVLLCCFFPSIVTWLPAAVMN